jgi:hypothetical protein
MWNLSYVLNILLLFSICKIFIVFSIVEYLCPVSIICCTNLEHCLFFFMSLMCSLCLLLNARPVYLHGHSVRCSWYTPTPLYCNIILVLTSWEVYVPDILILYFYMCMWFVKYCFNGIQPPDGHVKPKYMRGLAIQSI